MNEARQRIIQSLSDARAQEQALVQTLNSQIAMAPRGSYRKGLQAHLKETRDHADRIETRLAELGRRPNVVQQGIKLLEGALGQGLAASRAPFGLLRSSGGPEKVLADAKDACATEASEIAAYAGIEGLAASIGDRRTARMAASIRAEEQKMLELLLKELPSLVKWVVEADVRGKAPASIAGNGAAASRRRPRRRTAAAAKPAARKKTSTRRKPSPAKTARARAAETSAAERPRKARRAARAKAQPKTGMRPARPRRSKDTPRAKAQTRTMRAAGSELPIAGYDMLSIEQVIGRLGALSPADLAKLDAHERGHQNRQPILGRIAALRGELRAYGYEERRLTGTRRESAGDTPRPGQTAPEADRERMTETEFANA